MSTGEAARILRTSAPTVRSLVATGQLVARREERGSRFVWWIDDGSVRRLLDQRGPYKGARRSKDARLEHLEADLRRLKTEIAARPSEARWTDAEAASLRVRVVDLQEALVRSRTAAEMQRQADSERAQVVRLLLDALAAAERADALRRAAISELEEGLAVFSRPGNPSEIA